MPRNRTARQLERKRVCDKESQKAKRERVKTDIKELQSELHDAREEVVHLRGVIEAMRSHPAPVENHDRHPAHPSNNYDHPGCKTSEASTASHPRSLPALEQRGTTQTSGVPTPSRTPLDRLPGQMGLQGKPANRTNGQTSHPKDDSHQIWRIDNGQSPYLAEMDQFNCEHVYGERYTVSQDQGLQSHDDMSVCIDAGCRLPPILGCRCEPKKHKSFSECVEWTIYTGITKMRHHQTATPPIPPTPEVVNLLFLREPEHEVAKTLMKLLKRPNQENLVIRCAVYVLAYRILRYRYFPSLETYNDIPDWLRPTPIQYNTPHPLYIDLVPFPRLRHALTLRVVDIDCIRDQFDADFGRHISVNWAFPNSLFVVNDYFNTVLNPEFERHVCAEENWSLDLEFARKYPTIAPLVTIRDENVVL